MNLAKGIVDQLSGEALEKLSSLVGSDSYAVRTAVEAAAPALLSSLGGMATRDDGAKKISNVLGQLGSAGDMDFMKLLGGDANSLAQKGSGLLSGLFGDNQISGLINSIGSYAGLGSSAAKGLLSFLAPMVLGKVASQWKALGSSPQAVTKLFAEQRENIATAMPDGFSLPDVAGWSRPQEATYAATSTARRAVADVRPAERSPARWAVPLALALLGGFLLYNVFKQRPDQDATAARTTDSARTVTVNKPVDPVTVPRTAPSLDPLVINRELQDLYASAKEVMGGITDAASAEAAMPKLEEISAKIDTARKTIAMLPAAGRTSLEKLAEGGVAEFKQQAETTLKVPGLGDNIKTLIGQIITKLAQLFAAA